MGHFKRSRLKKPNDNCFCSLYFVQARGQWRDLSVPFNQTKNSKVRWEEEDNEDQSPIISASDVIIKIPKYTVAANATFCALNDC